MMSLVVDTVAEQPRVHLQPCDDSTVGARNWPVRAMPGTALMKARLQIDMKRGTGLDLGTRV
jgi:hypothetical protein